jgi:hypothetical protein
MRKLWLVGAAATLLGLTPALANGQPDDTAAVGPTLSCNLIGLRVLNDDLNAVRLVCGVSGAPTSDTTFTVSVVQPAGVAEQSRTCANGLSSGTGRCVGGLFEPTTQLSVTATLEPSGLTLGPVSVGPATAPPAVEEPPILFYPLGN